MKSILQVLVLAGLIMTSCSTTIGYGGNHFKTQRIKYEEEQGNPDLHILYQNDISKWVFLDGQFNVMPVLNGRPLNAVEFQKAITGETEDLVISSLNEIARPGDYVHWIYPYLFYLDTSFDNRYGNEIQHTVNGKRSLMLVPAGAKKLSRIDFWDIEIDYCVYTNSILDFYASPFE